MNIQLTSLNLGGATPNESTMLLKIAAAIPLLEGDDAAEIATTGAVGPNNPTAIGWGRLPREVKDNIIRFAMTTKWAAISMPCLKDVYFEPGLAIHALRVNRYFYREGVRSLYRNNMIRFDHFGSDLKIMCNTWKTCRIDPPVFERVSFYIGDHRDPAIGQLKAHAFGNVIQQLKTAFRVRHLIIVLGPFHFLDLLELQAFASSLSKIEAEASFELLTCNPYVDFFINDFTQALKMDTQAVMTKTAPSYPGQFDTFHGYYRRAIEVNEVEKAGPGASNVQCEGKRAEIINQSEQAFTDTQVANREVDGEVWADVA